MRWSVKTLYKYLSEFVATHDIDVAEVTVGELLESMKDDIVREVMGE